MSNENFDKSLTSRQQWVLETLKVLETFKSVKGKKYPMSEWYYGALRVLNDVHNPDRFSQAANSLREVMEKLSEIEIGYRKKEEKLSKKEKIQRGLQKDDPMFDQLPSNAQQQRQRMGEEIKKI